MFFFRILSIGVLGYVGWRNRFRIQRYLESKGIKTPLMKGSFGETVQSGVAKLSGKAEHLAKPLDDESRRVG